MRDRRPSLLAIGRCERRIGLSVERRPIVAHVLGRTGPATLILAGMHGDEPKSVYVALKLLDCLQADPPERKIVLVPLVNPDGFERRRRRNGAGVDINRNFPTADWQTGPIRSRNYPGPSPASEPETRSLISLIESTRPAAIITIHSINRNRFCNNHDGPAGTLAAKMARRNGYPLRTSIGYPTPGSFGTYAGRERRIPTVTLELPSHHSPKRCWNDNREALAVCLDPCP